MFWNFRICIFCQTVHSVVKMSLNSKFYVLWMGWHCHISYSDTQSLSYEHLEWMFLLFRSSKEAPLRLAQPSRSTHHVQWKQLLFICYTKPHRYLTCDQNQHFLFAQFQDSKSNSDLTLLWVVRFVPLSYCLLLYRWYRMFCCNTMVVVLCSLTLL